MTRRLATIAMAIGVLLAIPAGGRAAGLPTSTPLLDARTHRPLSCPDPSVVHPPGRPYGYYLFCTTDGAPAAFAIYGSSDLEHWQPLGDVFPAGHEPGFTLPTGGRGDHGRFWGPSINFIDGRWVLYFSAAYDPAGRALAPGTLRSGAMVLAVATSPALSGPWHASLLHYPGELNAVNAPGHREYGSGDIDPATVRDPVTGQLLLAWAEQPEQIWLGGLSADGLSLGPVVQRAFAQSEPWECDPPTSRDCTLEGPQPLFHDGRLFMLYSAASTWDSSYAVGVASAPAPLDPFVKDPQPILRSGDGFLGPGGVSNPTTAPDGATIVLYHALRHPDPSHRSGQRVLMLGTLGWSASGEPTIDDGTP